MVAISKALHQPTSRVRPRSALHVIRDEHRSLAAMLSGMLSMIEQGPGDIPERFFDVMRAMLFYIDEFPERHHHPKESDLLFPKLVRKDPSLLAVVQRLETEHVGGPHRVRELQHLLLAWELLGESRRDEFEREGRAYIAFYFEHMRVEEKHLLPAAERLLDVEEHAELDAAFDRNEDPVQSGLNDPRYERLFTRIVLRAPAPVGVGPR